MSELSEVTCCVVDHGLNVGLAVELASRNEFKQVLYHNAAWIEAFPKLNKGCVGFGYPGVEIVDDYWAVKDDIQLFIFPDLYHAGEQLELERQGKLVWGSRNGDKTEMYRLGFMEALAKTGLPVPPFTSIRGLAALRDFLIEKEDKYIKISKWRGTLETTHWRNYDVDQAMLDSWAVKFGPFRDEILFLVFDAIKTELEIGVDTYSVIGEYPGLMIEGIECKDKAYLGTVKKREEMPSQLMDVLNAFAPELREVGYRNLLSCEVRIKGDVPFFTDPTRRFPCPAGATQLKIYENLCEILYFGAAGELVQPQMAAQFSAECMMTVKGKKDLWSEIRFPPKLKDHVFCAGSCLMDGRICTPPDDSDDDGIGWLVFQADTPKETIEGLLELTDHLPDGVNACAQDLISVLEEIETAEKEEIPFTEQPMPTPEDIVAN